MKKSHLITVSFLLISLNLIADGVPESESGWINWLKGNRTHKENLILKNKEEIKSMLDDKAWTIEAKSHIVNKGRSYPLSGESNFIMINGDCAAIQLSSNYNRYGGNEISISGSIVSYKIFNHNDPKGPTKIEMEVSNDFSGSSKIEVYIDFKGNAIVDVNPATGEKFTCKGILLTEYDDNRQG